LEQVIKIGTRSSALALWQANHVAELLASAGIETELVSIETKGDKVLNKSIAKIGSKGVFTEELEEMLRSGAVNIAVHSAKDVQADLPNDMELLAFCEREKPNDVVLSFNKYFKLDTQLTWVIGTASTRRVAMLKHLYPRLRTANVRGNLQTRLRKLEEGLCDALILAYAGVKRMGLENIVVEELSIDVFTPPVGQGAVAVEVSKKMPSKLKTTLKKIINHDPTEKCLLAERAFLQKLKGGCSIPSFAYAELNEEGNLYIRGGLVSLDGKQIVREEVVGKNPAEIGTKLGEMVLENKGAEILANIRKNL
jgi:hydroxymethylbilane synthase